MDTIYLILMTLFIMIYVLLIQLKIKLIYYYMIEEWIFINQLLIYLYVKMDVIFNLIILSQRKQNVIVLFKIIK